MTRPIAPSPDPRRAAPLRLVQTMPLALRLVLAGLGLFAILAPVVSFRAVLFQPGVAALPFWAIALGAAALGGTVLVGVILGDDTELEIAGETILLIRRNPFRREERRLEPGDITLVTVRRVEWDSGPDTHAVEVRLRHGAPVGSRRFPQRQEAEALALRVRQALGQA